MIKINLVKVKWERVLSGRIQELEMYIEEHDKLKGAYCYQQYAFKVAQSRKLLKLNIFLLDILLGRREPLPKLVLFNTKNPSSELPKYIGRSYLELED